MWPVFCLLSQRLELSAMRRFLRDTNDAFRGLKAGPPAGGLMQRMARLPGFVAPTHDFIEDDETGAACRMALIFSVDVAFVAQSMAFLIMAITAMVLEAEMPGCRTSSVVTAPSISTSDQTSGESGDRFSRSGDKSVLMASPAATFGDTRRQKFGVQISDCCGVFQDERVHASRDHWAEKICSRRVRAIVSRPLSGGTHFPTLMRPGSSPEKGSGTTTKNDRTQKHPSECHFSSRSPASEVVHLRGITCADLCALGCGRFAIPTRQPKGRLTANSSKRTCVSHVACPSSFETEGLLNSMHSAQACDTMPHERGSFQRPPVWWSYPHFLHTSPRGIS